jgi:hypothetical protein
MAASIRTVQAIVSLIEKRADDPMRFAHELAGIEGNKSFKDTTTAIIKELAARGHKVYG